MFAVIISFVRAFALPGLDKLGQAVGHQISILAVFLDDVGDVIADNGGKPAGLLNTLLNIADPNRRTR